jgi:hypothetical protein
MSFSFFQIFGPVTNPYTGEYQGTADKNGEINGLIFFFTNILRLFFLLAGIFALLKIIIAGFGFISAGGEPKKIEQAWVNIWQSIVGLLIIVSSFVMAAIIGQLFFGNPLFIISPELFGVGT